MAGCCTPNVCVGHQQRVGEWNICIALLETQLVMAVEQSPTFMGGHTYPSQGAGGDQAGLACLSQCWAMWAAGRGSMSPFWPLRWCPMQCFCNGANVEFYLFFNASVFRCGTVWTWSGINVTVPAQVCWDVWYRESYLLYREIKCCRGVVKTQTWLY